MTTPGRRQLREAGFRLLFVLGVAAADGAFAAAAPGREALSACLGRPEALQRLRDNLQTASTYLKATKNNFGPGRQGAIDETAKAIAELDRLQGDDRLPPAPAAKEAAYLGEHGHPRMMFARNVLEAAKKDLAGPACEQEESLRPLRQSVRKALEKVDDALRVNPPWSRH